MKRAFALILTMVLILSCAGCAEKTPHTVESFTSVMEEAGYTVQDVTEDVQTNGVEVTVLVAENDDFRIEFYQFANESTASRVFAGNKAAAEELSSRVSVSVNLGSFSKYEYTTDSEFCCIARIGNTMIYCLTENEHQDAVKSVVETLGYN